MTGQNVIDLKEQVDKWKKGKEKLNNLQNEKEQLIKQKLLLEKDPKIQEYLKILTSIEQKDIDLEEYDDDLRWKWNEESIINYYAHSTESNHIYVCIGTYPEKAINPRIIDFRTFDDDKVLSLDADNVKYRVYSDIETEKFRDIVVEKSNWEEFEKNNIVLFPPDNNSVKNSLSFYESVKTLFYKTSIESSQEEAIQKVLQFKNSKSI